jgi:hypothetical protein
MEYTYEIDDDYKIIIVTVLGNLITNEVALMGKTIRHKALIMNYNILFDFRNSRNQLSITEAYFWFADYYDKIDLGFRSIRTAHLTNENDKQFFYFMETTSFNRGIKIKMFTEIEHALEYLKPTSDPHPVVHKQHRILSDKQN